MLLQIGAVSLEIRLTSWFPLCLLMISPAINDTNDHETKHPPFPGTQSCSLMKLYIEPVLYVIDYFNHSKLFQLTSIRDTVEKEGILSNKHKSQKKYCDLQPLFPSNKEEPPFKEVILEMTALLYQLCFCNSFILRRLMTASLRFNSASHSGSPS